MSRPTRLVPTILRTLSTTSPSSSSSHGSSPTSNSPKDHHVITYPPSAFPTGYAVGSTHCGIKKKSGALDLGVLVSTGGAMSAAACTTRNAFKAAPVVVTSELLDTHKGKALGFVVNSGCANAVTGKQGLENAWKMSKSVTELHPNNNTKDKLGEDGGTLVMSTGVIGQQLPIDSIISAIPRMVRNVDTTPEAWMNLAKAFMTTDTFPKLRTRSFKLGNRTIRFVGIDKGAGMIAPSMGTPIPPSPTHATLLGVIATDAAIHPKSLQSALQYAVDRSFNSITVDGDMSTNDTILCLANGQAVASETSGGSEKMEEITEEKEEFAVFREELRDFAKELAQLVVRDGEGATKFVTVKVKGAPSFDVANAVAKSVASSSLVKTALYGQDANWGRILCAVGYTDLPPSSSINPSHVSVSFNPPSSSSNTTPLQLLTNGEPELGIDEERASEILKEENLEVVVDLGQKGGEEATVWTCDFSHDYVTINGSYRS